MTVREFLTWWRSELAGMLPEGLRRRFSRRAQTLRLTPRGDELRISRRDNGREEDRGRVDMGRPEAGTQVEACLGGLRAEATRVEVAVPPEKLLVKRLQLPLAAEENLREVLGFEMQRQTPFRAEQVYYNFRVLARRPATQQLDVALAVVPRAVIETVLGLLPDWSLVQDPGGRPGDADEDAEGVFAFVSDAEWRSRASMPRRALAAANVALLVAVIAIPLFQQRQYLDDLRNRLAEVRTAAAAASSLQRTVDEHRDRASYLFARKIARPTSVELLEELSRRLPDDTWLYRAEIRDGRVHLQGTSSRASALIGELEASGFLEGVRFASPVTQDGATGRERFHLTAAVVTPAAPGALAGNAEEGRDS